MIKIYFFFFFLYFLFYIHIFYILLILFDMLRKIRNNFWLRELLLLADNEAL